MFKLLCFKSINENILWYDDVIIYIITLRSKPFYDKVRNYIIVLAAVTKYNTLWNYSFRF